MNRQNVAFGIGSVALIDKADAQTGFFKTVFGSIGGKARDFIPAIKLLMVNKLEESVAIHRLLDFMPIEKLSLLGFRKGISDRTLNRTLERLGEKSQFIIDYYQQWVKENKLNDQIQNVDFSSSYFEGNDCTLAKLGYSRDHQPGKPQITYGISIGANRIPTALTIQKGNVNDRTHMKKMLNLCTRILIPKSLLVFDCGGNTKKNKEKILKLGFHYLTLRGKKVGPYREAISFFKASTQEKIEINDSVCFCTKRERNMEFQYIFFSQKLADDQLAKKKRKFKRELEKGVSLEKKVLAGKELGRQVYDKGWIISEGKLQKTVGKVENPYITRIEGFFILESSLDLEASEILRLYREKDVVEKFIRDLKEGAEMRPIRHWSDAAVIGYVLLVFLTNAIVNLTLLLSKNPLVKNLKVLKKYLNNLTVSVIYPKGWFKIEAITNFSDEMRALFGDFLKKYGQIEPQIWR
jgi:transposase